MMIQFFVKFRIGDSHHPIKIFALNNQTQTFPEHKGNLDIVTIA